VVLDSKREQVRFVLDPLAKRLINVEPDTISYVALALAGLAGLLFFLSWEWTLLLPMAALVVIVSGLLDALDGKVAKMTGKASRRGDFLDHVLDRYADVLMIGGVAVSGWCDPYLGMLALVGVLLTSYMGTQAQAVGVKRMYAGLLGRADRVVLMFIFPLLQYAMVLLDGRYLDLAVIELTLMEVMMLWFAIIGNLTAVQRAYSTFKSIK
jgi:archaetidylinositol phosphate synthase